MTLDDASKTLTIAAFQTLSSFADIRTFRRIALAGPGIASGAIYQEWFDFPDFLDKLGWHFPNREQVFSPDWRHKLSAEGTTRMLRTASSAVHAASLVFAHSLLDDLASECCRVSALASPEDWITEIEKQQVSLEQLRTSSYDELARTYLQAKLEQLRRESLSKRLDLINRKCQPVPPYLHNGTTYVFDGTRLKKLDKQRQDIIHRVEFVRDLSEIDSDLDYIEATCRFLVWMLASAHQLSIDLGYWVRWRQESSNSDR